MKFKSLFFYPYAPMGYIKIIVGSIAPKQLDNNFIPVYKNLILSIFRNKIQKYRPIMINT